MKPLTPLDKEFFKRKNLVDLAGIIATNHACDWHVFPFAQKYYGLAWQILYIKFVRLDIRLLWHSVILAR